MCVYIIMFGLLVTIVTALSERESECRDPAVDWFFFHRSSLLPAFVGEVTEIMRIVSVLKTLRHLNVYSPPCRCFSSADKYPSEEEHLCGNSFLDGSRGTVKLAYKYSCSPFPFHYISLEQIPVGWDNHQRDNTVKYNVRGKNGVGSLHHSSPI